MGRAYLLSSLALNAVLCLVGAAMVITTLARGGGPLTLGVLLGLALAGLGVARLRLARGAARRTPE